MSLPYGMSNVEAYFENGVLWDDIVTIDKFGQLLSACVLQAETSRREPRKPCHYISSCLPSDSVLYMLFSFCKETLHNSL